MFLSICRCYPKQSVSIYNNVQVLYTSKTPNVCVHLMTGPVLCGTPQNIPCLHIAVKGVCPFYDICDALCCSFHLKDVPPSSVIGQV